MKKTLLASLLMVSASFGSQAFAASGSLAVTGAIIDQGCDVVAGSDALNIELGIVDGSAFGGVPGTTMGSAPVKISLANCPDTITGVGVVFDGPTDTANTNLLAISGGGTTATGVGVAFYESDSSTLLPLHTQSVFSELAEGQTTATLNYVAKYMSTSDVVVGGEANAVANFTLVYN